MPLGIGSSAVTSPESAIVRLEADAEGEARAPSRACAIVDGRVVATWGLRDSTLTMKLLEPLNAPTVNALRDGAADVFRFLGPADQPEVVIAQ